MSWVLTFPLATPFATAVIAYLLRNQPSGRWVSVAGSLIATLLAGFLLIEVLDQGVIATQMSSWPAPFGITLVADTISAIMVFLTAMVGLAVSVYAIGEIGEKLESLGYHTVFQLLLGGVTGAFLTGDIFNLYVWFEVMLISSFGLLIMGGTREQIDGAVKYVTLNLVSTVLFLSGIGLLYGVTGTLNMADLHSAVANSTRPELLHVVATFFLIAFGMKAAVFPLFSWLPASYHTPTYAVSAVFAALLTKVGVYSLFRVFTLIFTGDSDYTSTLLLWVAAFTMITGVLGALAQTELRRILSFQIICSIGFLIMGLALKSPLAMAGAIFYLMHTVVVKANLFLTAGVMIRLTGSSDLRTMGGLYRTAPLLGVLFLIPAFALAGFPPLSGFWAKLLLVKAALDLSNWWIAATALVAGLLTIYSMTIIWAQAFWKPHPEAREPALPQLGRDYAPLLVPIACLGAVTILIGLVPEPFVQLAQSAADQLLDPTDYITTVLGASE